jgi:hypothetical protein
LEEGVKIYTNEVVCPWGGASRGPQNQKLRKINLFHGQQMSSDAKSSLGLWSGELTIYKSMCNNKITTRYVHLCTITMIDICPWGGASRGPQNQKLRKINLFHVMVQVNVNYVYL